MSRRVNVGLLTSNLADPFDHGVYTGAAKGAEEADANLFVFPGRYLKPDLYDKERSVTDYQYNSVFAFAAAPKLDVLLVLSGTIATTLKEEDKREFLSTFGKKPIILIADSMEGYPSIGFDNKVGLREGITRLIEVSGCKAIGMVSGPITNLDAVERLEVYKEVLTAHDMEVREDRIVYGNFSEYSEEVVRQLLDTAPELDGLVFANDQMAVGAYNVFKERNLVIGRDIKVVGFDDSPTASKLAPGLSSVRADSVELGRRALHQAVEYYRNGKCDFTSVDTFYISRDSSGEGQGKKYEDAFLEEFWDTLDADKEKACELLLTKLHSNPEKGAPESEVLKYLKGLTENFLSVLHDGDGERYKDSTFYYLERATVAMKEQGEDIRILYRLLELFHALLDGCQDKDRVTHVQDYLLSCQGQQLHILNGLEEKERERMINIQWMSNSLARDMLSYGEQVEEGYWSVNDKLIRLGVTASYLYVLREPYINTEDKLISSWKLPKHLYLKSYYNQCDNIVKVPRGEQEIRVFDAFWNRYVDPERRYTLQINLLFINTEILGFLICELPSQKQNYMQPISAQLSAAIKIMYMINTQREIRRQLENNNEYLEAISKMDELTGVYNRRGFREVADQVLHNPLYRGKKAILVYADMDNLKLVNDRMGHDEGDYSLRLVAQVLRESMRAEDLVARIGGDEFMAMTVVNDGMDGEQIRVRIKEMMTRFNEHSLKPFYVDVSVGYSEFRCGKSVNIESYMGLADAKLYEDKKNKRKDIMK